MSDETAYTLATSTVGSKTRLVFAIVRIDEFMPPETPIENRISVKKIVDTVDQAELEIERLNKLQGSGVRYLYQATRMEAATSQREAQSAAEGGEAPTVEATPTSLSIDDLVAAKKLVGQVGSIEKVREALAAMARLS